MWYNHCAEDYEYVVKPNQKNEIRLQRHSSVLYFLQNIRDEAHRFAIEFQRKLKRQDNLKSLLDEIPGVGNRRKRALLKHFGSLKRVREASVEELRQVSGISPVLAEEIFRFFKECDSFLKKKYAASQKESWQLLGRNLYLSAFAEPSAGPHRLEA